MITPLSARFCSCDILDLNGEVLWKAEEVIPPKIFNIELNIFVMNPYYFKCANMEYCLDTETNTIVERPVIKEQQKP